jgi:hypothetical protein
MDQCNKKIWSQGSGVELQVKGTIALSFACDHGPTYRAPTGSVINWMHLASTIRTQILAHNRHFKILGPTASDLTAFSNYRY